VNPSEYAFLRDQLRRVAPGIPAPDAEVQEAVADFLTAVRYGESWVTRCAWCGRVLSVSVAPRCGVSGACRFCGHPELVGGSERVEQEES
jgi:rRNA maturation endonuclease Nob1